MNRSALKKPATFARKKFISLSARGEFLFSRGLFLEENLDLSTHCYLAYSPSRKTVLFCFTKAILAAGAFQLKHRRPKGSLLEAPAFFENFNLDPKKLAGIYPVEKATFDDVTWHAIRFP